MLPYSAETKVLNHKDTKSTTKAINPELFVSFVPFVVNPFFLPLNRHPVTSTV